MPVSEWPFLLTLVLEGRRIPKIVKITILELVRNNASLEQRYITVPYIPDWWLTSYFTARAGDNMT